MVISFLKFEQGKEMQLLKQTTTNNTPIPTLMARVVIDNNNYKVSDIEYNYDTGIILIALK